MIAQKEEKTAIEFTESINSKLGADLKMAALYGSIAREGDFKEGRSDINILFVASNLDTGVFGDISSIVQRAKEDSRISPLFLLEKELHKISEFFPIKFYEIKKFHKVIYGDDILQNIPIEWKFLKERVQQEILNIKMKLRKSLLFSSPKANLVARPLRVFIPHILSILRVVMETPESQKFNEDDEFYRTLNEKRGHIESAGYEEIKEIYDLIFSNIDSLLRAVERV